jgi:hypothetical protein
MESAGVVQRRPSSMLSEERARTRRGWPCWLRRHRDRRRPGIAGHPLRRRRRRGRLDCGPGISRRRGVARDRAPTSAGGRAALACRASVGAGATAHQLSTIHRRPWWVVHKHVEPTGRSRPVLGAHRRTDVDAWWRRHAGYLSRCGRRASDRPGGDSGFGVCVFIHCRFRAAYPVRETPRWSARRRAHYSRTSDLPRRASDAFSATVRPEAVN